MKILVLCQYFYPEQFLINDIVPELVRNGHDVTVLTGRPNYPDGKIKKGYPKNDIYHGARIIRCHEIGRSKGVVLNYLSFLFSASRHMSRTKETYDLIFCYQLSPITMAAPLRQYAKKHSKIKSLLYCLDIWPESFNSHMPIGFVKRIVRNYSRKVYKMYDKILVSSEPFAEYLNRVNGIELSRIDYLPQHGVGGLLNKDLSSNNKIPHFMFAGNLGSGQSVETIINALNLVDRDYVMDFVGCGSKEKELKEMTHKFGLDKKIIFHGRKTYDEMEKMYKTADALLITLRGNNEVGNTLPGKFQTYMSAGKPIFGSINGAAFNLIKESKCGDCVKACDYEGLSRLLTDFLDNRGRYADCGNNARTYFKEHFTLEIFMNKLEKEIESL